MAKDRIAEAVLVLSIDDKEYKATLKQIPKDADRAAAAVKGIGQAVDFAVFKEFGQMVAGAFKAVGAEFEQLVTRGAEVQGIETAFSNLTSAIGETKDSMLSTSQQATKGLISDFDLMAAGNKALLLGLPVTAESFGGMAKAATVLGRAMGQDAKKSFDDLITALGRGSPMILDNLGITVKVSDANETYAKSIGKSADSLTDAEKKQAFYNAATEAAAAKVATIGDLQLTLADSILIARNRWQNFTDALGVAINQSPVLKAGMQAMGVALGDAFGTDQKSNVDALTRLIEDFVIGLTYVAQAAVAMGSVFFTVFSAMETVVNGILTGVTGFAGLIMTNVEAIAKLAAAFPGATAQAKVFAADVTALRQGLDAMAFSLAKSTAESAKGVIGQGALHEKLDAMGGVIMRVRDAMESASGKTAKTTQAVKQLAAAAPVAAGRTQESAQKIAEAFRALNDEMVADTAVGLEKRLVDIDQARAKEIAGLTALKDMTVAEHTEMERLINEKYRLRVEAAKLAGDEVANKEREVQDAIALSLTTGTANKLLQIQIARDKEIEGLAFLKLAHEQRYAEDVAAVNEKYRIQTEAAQGHYQSIELMMAANGWKTRTQLEEELVVAQAHLDQLEASEEKTQSAIDAARKKVHDLQIERDGVEALSARKKFDIISESASTMLRSLFGKNKAAAIASAIIDTAAAAVAAFKNAGGLPFGAFAAAATVAAGYAQIKTIRETDAGFAQGTPGLDFMDFGVESFRPLHNQEAVIPRGGGHLLAGEIADSMPGEDEELSLLRRIANALEGMPAENRKAFRNALLLDKA